MIIEEHQYKLPVEIEEKNKRIRDMQKSELKIKWDEPDLRVAKENLNDSIWERPKVIIRKPQKSYTP